MADKIAAFFGRIVFPQHAGPLLPKFGRIISRNMEDKIAAFFGRIVFPRHAGPLLHFWQNHIHLCIIVFDKYNKAFMT